MKQYTQSPCSIHSQSYMPDWLKDALAEIDDHIKLSTALINDKMSAKELTVAIERINTLQLAKKIVFEHFVLTQ